MTSSKHCRPRVKFKAASAFRFPNTDESYRATVRLESSGLMNTWLHDFRVAYTPLQANLVAASLIQSIIHLIVPKGQDERSTELNDRVGIWTKLIVPSMPKSQIGTDDIQWRGFGEAFVASGAFLDPDPAVGFKDEAGAIYDLTIRPYGESIMLKFGWVEWVLSPAEAEWLADQLWTAAHLAAKQTKALS
ncbi:conserved protein of unknown function [Pseudomonas putida KT2440]|uniref:Uncharacterized protein n=2 Tax=Pseudomonas TaxID=286 RepID=A0A140FWP1_PSEPK|nr:conserved protein of unknown function [Pseudomonas putida KT2440]KMU96447.1 hypothetical protein AC138_09200 [Pseudomonas putida]KMY28635.1 hypothetical protein AA993_22640 [Pseudomonas putida]